MKTEKPNLRTRIVQRIHDKTGYLLTTTKADRKEDRNWRKAARRVRRLQRLRGFKPFDLGCVRWLQQRQNKRIKVQAFGVSSPLPE